MRNSSLFTLAIAIVLGLLAVMVMNRRIAGSKVAIPTVEVLVAKVNLARGIELTPDMVELKQVALELVGAGSLKKTEDAIERAVLAPIAKGEIVLENRLGPKGANGLAVQITEGMRAFTIETPKLSTGVGGMIQPGNHVDVILTITDTSRTENSDFTGGGSSTVLLQNIEVLAVDRQTDTPDASGKSAKSTKDSKDTKSVTLLVTPEQSAQLTLGQTKGTLFLSLRHPNDDDYAKTRPATLKDMQFMQQGPSSISDRLTSLLVKLGRNDSETKQTSQVVNQKQEARPAVRPQEKVAKKRILRVIRGQSEELVTIRTNPVE
jgi:pilus assembly protein CpaB